MSDPDDTATLPAAGDPYRVGALTMQILKSISGYPSLLFDERTYDFENRVLVCCNCGAQPSWYAARSDDPAENLARVFLEPVIDKYGGGGAHFTYICREGEITLARLSRVEGRYRMFVGRGEFVDAFDTNHLHVVPGDHVEALKLYCELMDIDFDLADGGS